MVPERRLRQLEPLQLRQEVSPVSLLNRRLSSLTKSSIHPHFPDHTLVDMSSAFYS